MEEINRLTLKIGDASRLKILGHMMRSQLKWAKWIGMSLFLYGFCWQGLAQSFDFGTFMANEGRSHTFVIHNQTKNVLKR